MTAILQRHGQIAPEAAPQHTAWQRFEHDAPNRLWQMDFKGHFALLAGRCHPLTVLDDHSRFAVGLQACGDETGRTVQSRLTACFRRYGLPEALLVDNGPPWGSDAAHPYTPLTAWLRRLGVRVSHGRPYHPQTQGKDERFHRTLKAEVLGTRVLRDLAQCQRAFDRWREVYNLQRPHEALAMAVPASRYRVSPRAFPEVLPPIEYGPADLVRKVADGGELSYRNRTFRVGKAFRGYPVALRPTLVDGVLDVFFCHQKVAQINLRDHDELP
jgi:transposase InsO family protein